MKNLPLNKSFLINPFRLGFLSGVVIFIVIHLYNFLVVINGESYVSSKGVSMHISYRFGLPFAIYEWSGYSTKSTFYLTGLLGDVFTVVVFSFLLGLIFKSIWSKISSRRVKLK
jgi:hypothetical protein